MQNWQEWKFEFGDMTFRGKRWGKPGGLPVIALHGWLDNCASFDFVAPQLNGIDLLALDLAGQGKSAHRSQGGAYNIWLDIMEVIAVADQLGWKKFALLGHSRGAMISTLIAGTFPERVSHLAVIEAFAPHVIAAEEAPQQMASAVMALLEMNRKARSMFDSFEQAVTAREQGMLKLCHADALTLAKRGVKEKDGQFFWDNDIKLNAPSEVKFTFEQVRAFVDRIDTKISLIIADDGIFNDFTSMNELIEQTPKVDVVHLPGDHHLHMSQQCEKVADEINRYFAN